MEAASASRVLQKWIKACSCQMKFVHTERARDKLTIYVYPPVESAEHASATCITAPCARATFVRVLRNKSALRERRERPMARMGVPYA